jgi:DNA-binding MarR family transcriptional regulator
METKVKTEEAAALEKAEEIISYLRTAIDPTATLSLVATFLAAVIRDDQTVTEIAARVGAPLSTVSRHLLDMSDRARGGASGYGLMVGTNDPNNLRNRYYRPTPKGRLLAAALSKMIRSAPDVDRG